MFTNKLYARRNFLAYLTKKNATVKWIFAENSVIFYKFSLYFKVLFLHFIPSNFAL